MPTRILGLIMVGGALLQFLGSFLAQHADVGGFVYLIAGFGVLCGSQAALRFTALCGCAVMVDCLAPIVWSLAMGRPLEFRGRVFDLAAPGFWTDYFLPAIFMFGESLLACAVLRHRQLIYRTKAMKLFTTMVAGLFLGRATFEVFHEVRNRQTLRMFPQEVRIAEGFLRIHRGMLSPPATDAPMHEIMAMPSLHAISFSEGSAKGWGWTSSASIPPDQLRRATHWVKLPSGKWGKIEFEFIDQAPR